MKKFLAFVMSLMLCLSAAAAEAPVQADPVEELLSPFMFDLPDDVTAALAPGEASVSFVHENGATRAVGMVLSRVPDENGDHAAELQRLMAQFAPAAEEGMPLGLTPGFYGLMAVTPGALEGIGGARVDQVTIMVLWQTALRGELLILSGYDMSGDTARAEAMLNLLMRSVTVNDAPVVPVEAPAKEE